MIAILSSAITDDVYFFSKDPDYGQCLRIIKRCLRIIKRM